eukprot:COSAG02_NODE_3736_length_6305_cov_9.603609_2_plen_725_part_00
MVWPDGKRCTEWADGQRQTKWPSGKEETILSSGQRQLSEPDGTEVRATCAHIYHHANTSVCHPILSIVCTPARGLLKATCAFLQITEFPSGQKRTVKPDGTEIIEFGGGGGRQTNFPDGTEEVVLPSGQTQTTFPDGKKVTEFDDGQRQTSWKGGKTETLTPSGMRLVTWPDGTEVSITPNQHDRAALPDGTSVTVFADGQIQIVFVDGTEETILPNGTRQTLYPNGKKRVAFPDGQRQTTWPDSSHETVLPNGQRQTSYPDGKKVVEFPDGQQQITHTDGSKETIWPDAVNNDRNEEAVADAGVQSSKRPADEKESIALQAHTQATDDAIAVAAAAVRRVTEDIEKESAAAAEARDAKIAAKKEAARQAAEAAAAVAKREEDRLAALAAKEAAAQAEADRAKKLSRLPTYSKPSPPQGIVRLSGTGHTPRRTSSALEPLKREAKAAASWVQSWPAELEPLVAFPAVRTYMQRSELNHLNDCYRMTQEHVDELATKLAMQQPVLPPSSLEDRQGDKLTTTTAASTALQKLWRRVAAFQRWDVNRKGVLNFRDVELAIYTAFSREMVAILLGKDNLQDKFDAIDTRKEGTIRFSDFFVHCSIDPKFFGLIKNETVVQSQPLSILPMQENMLKELKMVSDQPDGTSGLVDVWDPATERWFERLGSLGQVSTDTMAASEGVCEGASLTHKAGVETQSRLGKLLETCVIREGTTGDVYAVARIRRRDK